MAEDNCTGSRSNPEISATSGTAKINRKYTVENDVDSKDKLERGINEQKTNYSNRRVVPGSNFAAFRAGT
jgi:hypothetical protein